MKIKPLQISRVPVTPHVAIWESVVLLYNSMLYFWTFQFLPFFFRKVHFSIFQGHLSIFSDETKNRLAKHTLLLLFKFVVRNTLKMSIFTSNSTCSTHSDKITPNYGNMSLFLRPELKKISRQSKKNQSPCNSV